MVLAMAESMLEYGVVPQPRGATGKEALVVNS